MLKWGLLILLSLVIVIVILSLVISKKNKQIRDLKTLITSLKEVQENMREQYQLYIKKENELNEKLKEIRSDNGDIDIDAANKFLQDLHNHV